MPVTIKACSLCRIEVQDALEKAGLPATKTNNTARNTSTFVVQLPSRSTLKPDSLAMLCWNALKFTSHATTKSGDTMTCSGCR